MLSDHAFRWSASLANWITGQQPRRPRQRPSLTLHNSRRGKSPWWDRFVALWWVKPDPTAPPTPRFPRRLPSDATTTAGGGGGADPPQTAYNSAHKKKRKQWNRNGLVQLVFVLLFLLGLFELLQAGTNTGRKRSQRRRRVDSAKMNLAHRDPHKLLAQLVPTSPPSRYSTRINPPGADSEDSSLLTEDPLAQDLEMYEEASEVGDTTAIVLHWKRTDNVRLVVAHLCRYTFFDSVLVWNNNPEIQLTHKVRAGALLNFFSFILLLTHLIPHSLNTGPQTFATSRCPASKLRIYNSPRNLLFIARFLACAQADTPYCYFQDDDWLVRPLRALYTQFGRDPEGPVVVQTSDQVSMLFGLEWCFYSASRVSLLSCD